MSYLWQTRLRGDTPFDPAYHLNTRVEIASELDRRHGHQYLEATRRALTAVNGGSVAPRLRRDRAMRGGGS